MGRRFVLLCGLMLACEGDEAAAPGTATAGLFTANGAVLDETTIYEDATVNNGGAYSELCVGNASSATTTRRGFVRYSLPSIPSTATITRVVLNLTQEPYTLLASPAPAATLDVHRVTSAWTEGDGGTSPTFTSCQFGTADSVNWGGAPAVAAASATAALPSITIATAVSIDTDVGAANDVLITDVQAWVNGTTNNGWRLSLVEETVGDNARSIRPGALAVSWTLANGGTCTTDGDCTGNACVHPDGLDCGGRAGCVCCNGATCTGACATCFRAGSLGTCGPSLAGSACRNASCTSGTATLAASCNGSSTSCPALMTQPCSPYVCSGTACGTTCAGPTECAAGFECSGANACVDAGSTDAGTDAGVEDAGTDAGVDDAGSTDAGPDAGVEDAGTDAGVEDAGTDAGVEDAGTDAGTADAGAVDAGAADAGSDPMTGRPGCGCAAPVESLPGTLLLVGLLARLRASRRSDARRRRTPGARPTTSGASLRGAR